MALCLQCIKPGLDLRVDRQRHYIIPLLSRLNYSVQVVMWIHPAYKKNAAPSYQTLNRLHRGRMGRWVWDSAAAVMRKAETQDHRHRTARFSTERSNNVTKEGTNRRKRTVYWATENRLVCHGLGYLVM